MKISYDFHPSQLVYLADTVEAIELPVTVWADEGREVTEFDFNMFGKYLSVYKCINNLNLKWSQHHS